jgi:GntR family transcriptional regulator/MocR family aminotransferase
MRFPLDRHSEQPLYQQIEAYLRQQILSGSLAAGTRLPATRQLAQALGISRITVKNAYAILESDGLVGGKEGSGTYVLPVFDTTASLPSSSPKTWPLWQQPFLEEPAATSYPTIKPGRPASEWISFTGVGDPLEFPVKDFYLTLRDVLRQEGTAALEYGEFGKGYAPLRSTITHILGSQGIQAHPENILITTGSQQALSLVCQVLLHPGDTLLVENPTYNLALELFKTLDLNVIGIPVDEQGMQTNILEGLIQKHSPRLIYTIPNFQNPSGVCLSAARRRQLLALADQYEIPILEDDFAGDLRYDGHIQPAIKALDPGGRVIYLGTFSKMLMPGLRVGFLAAEGPVLSRLVQLKRLTDLTTSPLLQRTLHAYVTIGRYQAHLRRSCRIYHKRRDVMLSAIKRHLSPWVKTTPPLGGLFIWLQLPDHLSSAQLLPLALEEGVVFSPGSLFFANPAEGERFLRLNFATQSPLKIEEGIRRLGAALQKLSSAKK